MATYQTKKCPHCGLAYVFGEMRGDGVRYGSPIRTCTHCGSCFIDSDYVELSTLSEEKLKSLYPPRREGVGFIIVGTLVSILILSLCLPFPIEGTEEVIFYIGLPFGLLSVFIGLQSFFSSRKDYDKRLEEFNTAIESSRIRMSNPDYAEVYYEIHSKKIKLKQFKSPRQS